MVAQDITLDYSKYDFKDKEDYLFKSPKGLTEDIVRAISNKKQEPKWMLDYRLKAFETFQKKYHAEPFGVQLDPFGIHLHPFEINTGSISSRRASKSMFFHWKMKHFGCQWLSGTARTRRKWT